MSRAAAPGKAVSTWSTSDRAAARALASADDHRPLILLVEDNAADADLIREALAGGPYDSDLRAVRDGQSALDFLNHDGPFEREPTPDLVLLDLNMPGLDGRAVLAIVKQDTRLRHIPVVVFSSSAAPDDVLCAYELRANCYVTKPVGLQQFMATLRAIERFWLGVASLPSSAGPVA